MTGEILIAELPRNRRETVRLTVQEFRGTLLVNLRVWYRPDDGGDMRPGRDGIAIRAEHAEWLKDAADRAAREVQKHGGAHE